MSDDTGGVLRKITCMVPRVQRNFFLYVSCSVCVGRKIPTVQIFFFTPLFCFFIHSSQLANYICSNVFYAIMSAEICFVQLCIKTFTFFPTGPKTGEFTSYLFVDSRIGNQQLLQGVESSLSAVPVRKKGYDVNSRKIQNYQQLNFLQILKEKGYVNIKTPVSLDIIFF